MARWRRAFTLVEVLVVVAIIGIVGAIVVPSMNATNSMVAQAATRAIVADLTTAQSQAIARQKPIYAVFAPSENRYKLVDQQGTIISQQWGGKQTRDWVDFDQDRQFQGVDLVSVSFSSGKMPENVDVQANQVIRFNDLGSPDSGGLIELSYADWQYTIEVAAFTGRITVSSQQP